MEGLDSVVAENLDYVGQAMMELSDNLADKALNPAREAAWPISPAQMDKSLAQVQAFKAQDLAEFLAGLYRLDV